MQDIYIDAHITESVSFVTVIVVHLEIGFELSRVGHKSKILILTIVNHRQYLKYPYHSQAYSIPCSSVVNNSHYHSQALSVVSIVDYSQL